MITAIDLEYSCKDFKEILSKVTPIQDDKEKMDLEPFPNKKDLVVFASKAYLDFMYELTAGLPEGWKLLTTARGGLNGYFGCAFWNSSLQQVVLAHRGSDFWKPGVWNVDVNGVYRNSYTGHMSSAVTFGDKIKSAILDANRRDGVRFGLTITGHSLGAWLAQITAMTIKHLKMQNKEFTRVLDIEEGLHTHTVAFDSPGVEDIVIKIQRDYGRYGSIPMFRSLDITTFFMATNLVNATGFHVGSMYQVSSNLVCTSGFKHMLSNIGTHSMENFAEAFGAGDTKLFLVKDWPQGWAERKLVHGLEQAQRTHRPETEGGQPVHYNIGEEDPGKSVRLNGFSELELDFIKWIRILRMNSIRGSHIEIFFTAKSLSLDNFLPNFAIDRKKNTVAFDSKQHLEKFVKNIKNSLRWFSSELQVVMERQSRCSTPGLLFHMASQEYLDSVLDLPACEDTLGLREFTEMTTRVLYIQAADCNLEIARVFNVLCQLDNFYTDINHFAFLEWESLVKLDAFLKIRDLPETLTKNHLLIVNFGSVSDITDSVRQVLKNVFSDLRKYSEKKVVIVSHINPDLFNFVKSFEPEMAIHCLPLSVEECLQFRIKDLRDLSRQELFSREFIALGEHSMSLNALLGENCQHSTSIDDVLEPIFKNLLQDESYKLPITNNLRNFFTSDVMYLRVNREVAPASLAEILREETNFLYVSSGARQLLEPLLLQVPGAVERVLNITGSSEEDFRQACLENSSVRVAYWLAAKDCRLSLKQIYNKSFYLYRQFHDQSFVDLEKLVQKENISDLFVFIGVEDKAALMRCLSTSSAVERLFCTNLKYKIENSGETAEGIGQCVNQHTLQVVGEGGSSLLVWQDSQGALDGLLPYLTTNSRILSEEDLCTRKVVIISDQPGMGKSTTLTSLSRYLKHSWVLRTDLRDRRADITNLPAQMSSESVVDFLAGADSEPVTRGLLLFCLQTRGTQQIHILLDGFDEIRDESAMEKVLKLCHFLKNDTTAMVIVTTRDSYKDVLIKRLSTFATIFENISEEDQLSFLVNFWCSLAKLGLGGDREQRDKRLRFFAQHLHEAAHKKLGGDIISLIGIPLQMTMLAEAFLQQAEQFSRNSESIPNIIGINNVYNLYKKFSSVKRGIYLTEKISMSSDMIGSIGDMLYEKITENHCLLAFQILDAEFTKKYLQVIKSDDEFQEMNRFGLTRWNRGTNCDFIHRTFAEFFCSHFLVLWLRSESFHFKNLPIEEWFLCNLLINRDFNVVRKFLDENLADNPLTESKQSLYNYMSKRLLEDVESLCDKDGQTALHVAAKENNSNIIDFLLGGLEAEHSRGAFESFLLARDCHGNTALKIALKILYPRNYEIILETDLSMIEDGSEIVSKKDLVKRIMQNISHLPYELKFKLLLSTFIENIVLPNTSKLLLECALDAKDQEDIQSALDRIEALENYVAFYFINQVQSNNTDFVRDFFFNELESDLERELLPLSQKEGQSAVNIASSKGNLELVRLFVMGSREVMKSRGMSGMTPLHYAVNGGHISVADFLLEQGTRLDVVDANGKTALSCASENGHLIIVKRLLERGADPKLHSADGRTALHRAVENGHLIIVKYLLSRADVNSRDENGKSVLYVATEMGNLAIAKHLLKCGALIELKEISGRTALSRAAETSLEILKHLLKCGADINTHDQQGKTPLYYAAVGMNRDIVEYLLKSGAEKSSVLFGDNGLYFTSSRSHPLITRILDKYA